MLKLEISYRVMISWKILVSFRGFFLKIIFLSGKNIWIFIVLLLLWDIFDVNGKATVWHTPCFSLFSLIPSSTVPLLCLVIYVFYALLQWVRPRFGDTSKMRGWTQPWVVLWPLVWGAWGPNLFPSCETYLELHGGVGWWYVHEMQPLKMLLKIA